MHFIKKSYCYLKVWKMPKMTHKLTDTFLEGVVTISGSVIGSMIKSHVKKKLM